MFMIFETMATKIDAARGLANFNLDCFGPTEWNEKLY
uniref:Uncharacterized protein n=1 Tax=Rhizophora mucronata TaxID=61149 RepID=A0A2P2QXR6_RHIMU